MSAEELKQAYIQLESEYDALKAENDSLRAQLGTENKDSTEKDDTLTAEYDEQRLDIINTEQITTADYQDAIRINIRFTNNSAEELYAWECFAASAYQDGMQLEEITDVNENSDIGNSANMIVPIKDGQSIEGSYVFALEDDSPVTLRIQTPTADAEALIDTIISLE